MDQPPTFWLPVSNCDAKKYLFLSSFIISRQIIAPYIVFAEDKSDVFPQAAKQIAR